MWMQVRGGRRLRRWRNGTRTSEDERGESGVDNPCPQMDRMPVLWCWTCQYNYVAHGNDSND